MDKQLYGVWDLSPKRDESKGMRLFRFKAKLNEIAKEVKLDAIVFERPAGFHKNALIVEAEIVGVLKLWCEENKIEYRAYSAGEIKKFATGCGNCSKDLMVEAAQDKLGMIGDDDNEADAMWLWQLAKKDLEG
jgi:Holliday junction resolvasome RuvABC endonuclease subunit